LNIEKAKCHCGNISADVGLSKDITEYIPRACDCEFCTKHGAAYLSDPKGSLEIQVDKPEQTTRYKQGSGLVDLLICSVCGVLVAVTYKHNGNLIGGINSRALENLKKLQPSVAASPKLLSDSEKINRWSEIWFSDVSIESKNK